MEAQYVPPFDFSTLGPNQSARWNAATEQWEIHDMPKSDVPA